MKFRIVKYDMWYYSQVLDEDGNWVVIGTCLFRRTTKWVIKSYIKKIKSPILIEEWEEEL